MIVWIEWEDRKVARLIATLRFEESRQSGRRDTINKPSLPNNILGCIGEIVVARALGIPWSRSINTFKSVPDVGPYDVRTRSKRWHDMLIRENDPDDREAVLVIPGPSLNKLEWEIVGKLSHRAGKQKQWLHTELGDPPVYYVPQRFLLPFTG